MGLSREVAIVEQLVLCCVGFEICWGGRRVFTALTVVLWVYHVFMYESWGLEL